jgi:hypothetical protein
MKIPNITGIGMLVPHVIGIHKIPSSVRAKRENNGGSKHRDHSEIETDEKNEQQYR